MVALIVFFGSLLTGLAGLYFLVWSRDRREMRMVEGVACLVGLLVAGFCGGRELMRTERDGTERNATELIATERNATERVGPKRSAEREERYGIVVAEIGPPPHPEAVPVLGYVTTAGVEYPPRWRMPPNSDDSDNLKR